MEDEKRFFDKLAEIKFKEEWSVKMEDILPYQYYSRIDLLCGFPWKPTFEIRCEE